MLASEGENAARPGQLEIFVRPFPNTGDGQWQVSTGGGTQPLWARSGRELFYLAAHGVTMMAVPVASSGTTWNAGDPVKLFRGQYYTRDSNLAREYDVSADGRRFLMIKPEPADPTAAPPHIVVVQHWDEELKRLMRSK